MKILIALLVLFVVFVLVFNYAAGKQNKEYDRKSDEYFKNKESK